MAAPETCPNCGADVPRCARACPECGSDEKTGWLEHAESQSLNLPDDEFNYDEFVQREFGKPKRPAMKTFWWIVAVLSLAVGLFFLLHR
jgi:predicted amidophosphoribosyltransferase